MAQILKNVRPGNLLLPLHYNEAVIRNTFE